MAGSRGGQYNLTISFGQTFMSTARAPKNKEVRETEQFVSKKKDNQTDVKFQSGQTTKSD